MVVCRERVDVRLRRPCGGQLSLESCEVAHSFVAEGVRSWIIVLREDECHSVQGYLVAGRYASA